MLRFQRVTILWAWEQKNRDLRLKEGEAQETTTEILRVAHKNDDSEGNDDSNGE
jgi:hypothetical protein